MPSDPRLPPLPLEQWDDDARELLRGRVGMADRYLSGAPDAPPLPNILGVLGHHPDLAAAWLAYNGLLLERGTVEPRARELVILRVAWRTGSRYEWEQHVRIALRAGMSPEQIGAVRIGPDAPIWSPPDALLVRAADELLDAHRVTDDTWRALAAHRDAKELLELLFVVGSYLCLALVFNSVELAPDPNAEPLPAGLAFDSTDLAPLDRADGEASPR
ncbi:carboxymuconolactone decarboxylase family protein [Nocardia barduliensis]|uniref:carboxymuconolactone decarboxylase family protein n=1 Tax=Nocardia barduliensis TaxID=2736643 RepID=UPI001C2D9B4C|nr:carboxymuconolactone decarboxylase family protein [Nocardia barduliensis]